MDNNIGDLIKEKSLRFYKDLKSNENSRYLSWEHCYSLFVKARDEEDIDEDYLSLQLAFYLASWGMYRGSSFLLQRDYKIHIPVVREVLSNKYDSLVGVNCSSYLDEANLALLKEINLFLKDYYGKIRSDVKKQEIKKDISDVLITKILMGTLGCVPAYDRYFASGITKTKVAKGNYDDESIIQLVKFYEDNKIELEKAREDMKIQDIPYPQMKVLDMGFWQFGFDLE